MQRMDWKKRGRSTDRSSTEDLTVSVVANEKKQKSILDRIDLDQLQLKFDRLEKKKNEMNEKQGERDHLNENSVFIIPDLNRTRLMSDAQLKEKKKCSILGEEERSGETWSRLLGLRAMATMFEG